MSSIAYQMFTKFKNNEPIYLFPKKPKRDFVYIDDVVLANIFAFENYNKLHSKYYEVGSGDAKCFEDVLDIMDIKYEYSSKNAIPKGYQFFTQSNYKKWMPNWKPQFNLEVGLTKYLKYLKNG